MLKIIIAVLFISSCGQNAASNDNSTLNQGDQSDQTIDDSVVDQIIAYYFQRFADYDEEYKLEKNVSDTLIELYYSATSLSSGHTIYIGLKPEDLVYGDIDNNGTTDLVMGLLNEYGGSGSSNEVFVFLNDDGNYTLSSVTNSTSICGCEDGSFYPEKIDYGLILGKSVCYDPGDAHCCPSLNFATSVKYQNENLSFNSKAAIE